MLRLNIEKRNTKDDLSVMRKGGNVPAVFYGKKEQSTPVVVSYADFVKVWKEAGSSSVVTLTGIGENKDALIQKMDIDPVSNKVRHIDFYVVESDKPVEVDVEIEFIGVSSAVKEMGGVLIKVMHELKIEALPRDLPQDIKVDISALKDFDSQILVKDVVLPKGVTAVGDPDEVVVLVNRQEEESESEVASVDLSAIKVEKKGKKEEEEINIV